MKKIGVHYQVIEIVRILFSLIFLISGIFKIIDLDSFSMSLNEFNLIPESLLLYFSYALPIIEICLGIGILLKIKINFILQSALFLLVLFTSVIISKISEGADISCGCFGNFTEGKIDYITVIRNVSFIIIGLLLKTYYQLKEKQTNTQKVTKTIYKENLLLNIKYNFQVLVFTIPCILLVVFANQNQVLKAKVLELSKDEEVLQPGEKVKPFYANSLTGNDTLITYEEKHNTLLLIMSANCEACRLNFSNWIDLAEHKNKNTKIVGVALNDLGLVKSYAKSYDPNFNIVSSNSGDFKLGYKAFKTPQTILIDTKGSVIKNWVGVLNNYRIEQIKSML